MTNDINIHVRHIKAAGAVSMVTDIAGGLSGTAGIIRMLTVMIWILAIAVLSIAFVMIAHERAKEFAVLRVMGASRGMLARLMLTESALISAAGAVCGLAAACLVIFPFGNLISSRLGLPYLSPGSGKILLLAAGSLVLSILAGALTSAAAVRRISRQDTALALKEGT